MAMGIMFERLGEIEFFKRKSNYNDVTTEYFYSFTEGGRFTENYDEFSIIPLSKWEHRFVGLTSIGVPIWITKKSWYKNSYGQLNRPVMPKDRTDVFTSDKECNTEELTSYTRWKRGKKKLAFIYLGVFWTLEVGESLNDAAKRFIFSHLDVEKAFNARRERGKHDFIDDSEVYIYELFNDGALIFHYGVATMEREHYFGTIEGLWAIAAAEGFFSRENVKEVLCTNKFN